MKNKTLHKGISLLCASAVITSTSLYMPAYAEEENIILSNAFNSDMEGWGGYANHEASASIDYDNGQIAVTISALGTVNYAVQLGSSVFALTENCTYQLSFDMYSTKARYIEAIFQQNGSSYQAYSAMPLSLTSEPQTFTHTFTMDSATDDNVKLVFNCGNHGEDIPEHTIYIDNVIITQLAGGDSGYAPYEPSITFNQLGYKPDDKKIAVFRDITSATEFSVVNAANDEAVYTGKLYGEKKNVLADEINFYGDFSSVTESGTYYITCGELDTSYVFEISENVYDDVIDSAVRMLYLQRCGCATVDETFGHDACHTGNALIAGTDTYIDVSGGWHDAGDYGRYIVPSSKAAADIMLAYQTNPTLYDDRTGIPESGNGIADILDEARYELEWMLKMQAESGGVYHKVGTINVCGTIMPEKDQSQLVVCPVSSAATADFCAVMAMAYEIFSDIDAEFAAKCLSAAKNAWSFLQEHPEQVYENWDDTAGAYEDSRDGDERYWAACQMYRATGDTAYLDAIDSITSTYYKDGLEWHMVGHYGNIALLTMDGIDTELAEYKKAMEMLFNWVQEYMSKAEEIGYNTAISRYTWGSNMSIANAGIVLGLAYRLTGDESYLETAKHQLDYLLGRNPNGMCYVTGSGTVSPENPHHRISGAAGQAMPGMLVGGVNSDLADEIAERYLSDTPPAKCYIDHSGSYTTNEITIYWNSPFVYLLSLTEDIEPEKIAGDVNGDGKFSVADAVMLQKWLMNAGEITDKSAGDVCEDYKINIFDLCVMKKMLIKAE